MYRIRNKLQRIQSFVINKLSGVQSTGETSNTASPPLLSRSRLEDRLSPRITHNKTFPVKVPEVKCEISTLNLSSPGTQGNIQPADVASIEKNQDTKESRPAVETVVHLDDAIRNGKNATPMDLEKALVTTQRDKGRPTTVGKSRQKDQQPKKVPAGESADLLASGRATTFQTAKNKSQGKTSKTTVEKLPDIFAMQGPLVGIRLPHVTSEKSVKSETKDRAIRPVLTEQAKANGLMKQHNSSQKELEEFSMEVEEVIARMSPSRETTPRTEPSGRVHYDLLNRELEHFNKQLDEVLGSSTPQPNSTKHEIKSKKKKSKTKKVTNHGSSRENDCVEPQQATKEHNANPLVYHNDQDKYGPDSQTGHNKRSKRSRNKKSKQNENTKPLSPVVIDKSPPKQHVFPDSDDSNDEEEECLQTVADMMLKEHWRPDVFPKRLAVNQLPSLHSEESIHNGDEHKTHGKLSKHRQVPLELTTSNNSATKVVIKPLDSTKKLPGIAPRCSSPKIAHERFVTPKQMYKPLPPPPMSHGEQATTPKDLYSTPIQTRQPIDLNGLLPTPKDLYASKPAPPIQPRETGTLAHNPRRGMYKPAAHESQTGHIIPAPPQQPREEGKRARRPKRSQRQPVLDSDDMHMPAPPPQLSETSISARRHERSHHQPEPADTDNLIHLPAPPRERKHVARPAGLYKPATTARPHAPNDDTAQFLPTPPQKPLSPLHARRVVRTMMAENAATRRLFQYETSDEEDEK